MVTDDHSPTRARAFAASNAATVATTASYGEIPWVTSLSEFPKLTGKSHGRHHSRIFQRDNAVLA